MPRRPPHFKVFTSAKNHEKLREVYQDNDLLALWLRLGVEAIERYADRTGDCFLVADSELIALSGKGRIDIARIWLLRLADISPISAERDGDVWRITVPNLAKKQFSRQFNGTQTGPPSSATTTSTTKPPPVRPPPSSKPSAVEKRQKRAPELPYPDPFPEAMRDKLYAWGPAHGFDRGQIDWGLETIQTKSAARGYLNRDWYRAIQGYFRSGWPLQGSQEGAGGGVAQNVAKAIEESRANARRRRRDAETRGGGRLEAQGGGQPVLDLHGDEGGRRDS